MPIEVVTLRDHPPPFERCPRCGASPFEPFLRGMVQRSPRRWWIFGRVRPHVAVICRACKNIVGYESPESGEVELVLPPPPR